jgi:hypothetical protein
MFSYDRMTRTFEIYVFEKSIGADCGNGLSSDTPNTVHESGNFSILEHILVGDWNIHHCP